jgi:hypothetical protein
MLVPVRLARLAASLVMMLAGHLFDDVHPLLAHTPALTSVGPRTTQDRRRQRCGQPM